MNWFLMPSLQRNVLAALMHEFTTNQAPVDPLLGHACARHRALREAEERLTFAVGEAFSDGLRVLLASP